MLLHELLLDVAGEGQLSRAGVWAPAAGGQESELDTENTGLFVSALVLQVFGKALGRIFVIGLSNLKATPITVYVWFCISQKTKRRFKKTPIHDLLVLRSHWPLAFRSAPAFEGEAIAPGGTAFAWGLPETLAPCGLPSARLELESRLFGEFLF